MKRPGYFLFLLAVLLIFPLKTSFANTITVDTTADEFDLAPNGTCSLREAVQTYNSGADFGGCMQVVDANPNTIDFAVPADTYVLDIPNSGGPYDDNSRGDIDICSNIIFNGGGIGVTIIQAQFPAQDPDRLFHINQPGATCQPPPPVPASDPTASGPPVLYTVVFNGVTIRDGNHQGPAFQGFLIGGGGIFNIGDLTVNDSEVTNNRADNSQDTQSLVMGGGIFTIGPAQINRSLIHTNAVMSLDMTNNGALGGGIAGTVADLPVLCNIDVTNTNVFDNVVENGSGGGAGTLDCFSMEILMSAFYDNHAIGSDGSPVGPVDYGSGGGVALFYDILNFGVFNLVDSTLSGNTAIKHGGGISLSDQYPQTSGNVTQLNSSTIASNVADADGNGMGDGGGFFISRATAIGSLFEFQNTIVADNTAVMGVDCFDESPNIDPVSIGYNLVRDPTGCNITGPQTGDLPAGSDPSLAPLADNGGLTLTRALRFDSEAIDMANPAGCEDAVASGVNLLFDQRDDPFNRVEPGSVGAVPRCDVGAYEFRTVEIVTEKQVSDALVQVGDTFTYTIVITNNGPGDATGVMVDDPLPAQVSFVSFGNISQGTCNQAAGVITCDLGNLAVNGVATVEVNVQAVAESNAVTNTATVMTNETPPQTPQATNQIIGGICVTGSGHFWDTIRPGCANCSLNPHAISLGFWRDYGPYLILGFLVAVALAFRRRKVRG